MTRGVPSLSREAAVFFLGVAAVSVAALIWTGWRLVRQDRELEARQLQERREIAADRVVAALIQALSAEERKLANLGNADFSPGEGDAVLLRATPSEIQVWPERALLFYPVVPPGPQAPAGLFDEIERSEYVLHDYRRAIRELRPLTTAWDPVVRAGAQLRLARNLRKAGELDTALEVYASLAAPADNGVSFAGLPAELAARRARCALLEETGRRSELEQEARSLLGDLHGKRWRLDRTSFFYCREQTARWLAREPEPDAEQEALADAVVWVWQNRQAIADVERGSSGRRSLRIHGASITVLWRYAGGGISAVVAGPGYQRSHWFEPLGRGPELGGVGISILDSEQALVHGSEPPAGTPVASRLASVTGLPWDVAVMTPGRRAVGDQFAQRRRLMMTALAMLALLIVTVSFLIGRAVSRELAAARLQSDFVSAVSHEFRTPLTSMQQFTEMLIENEDLPVEKRRAFYGVQTRATRRLSRLVESLLDFGRMEAGARPYRLEPLDAGALVRATVEDFRQEIGVEGLLIECETPHPGPTVRGDREALAQALWNLLDNAVKYSGYGPVVSVEVGDGAPVTIAVRDQGVGIPQPEQRRIFRKFIRGSNARAQSVKGTGIGLAMVKHIVDAHGGKVVVASEPGKGSTFTVVLPRGG